MIQTIKNALRPLLTYAAPAMLIAKTAWDLYRSLRSETKRDIAP